MLCTVSLMWSNPTPDRHPSPNPSPNPNLNPGSNPDPNPNPTYPNQGVLVVVLGIVMLSYAQHRRALNAQRTSEHAEHQLIPVNWSKVVRV